MAHPFRRILRGAKDDNFVLTTAAIDYEEDRDPMIDSAGMDETLRLERTYRNQALWCLLCFLCWAILGLFAAWTAPHPRISRVGVALTMESLPLLMTCGCLWSLVNYRRHELSIRGHRLTFRGVIRIVAFDLSEITKARWLYGQNGGIQLWTPSGRLDLFFKHYNADAVDRLIHHLRNAIDPQIQRDWNMFVYRTSMRMPRKPGPHEILLTRQRWTRTLVPAIIVSFVASVVVWAISGEVVGFVAPVFAIVLWAVMRFSTPIGGTVSPKLSDPRTAPIFIFTLLWFFVAWAGAMAWKKLGAHLAHPYAIAIVAITAWFAILVVEGERLDRRARRQEREAADLAAKARGEMMSDPWRSE